jgi:hypothetical protein
MPMKIGCSARFHRRYMFPSNTSYSVSIKFNYADRNVPRKETHCPKCCLKNPDKRCFNQLWLLKRMKPGPKRQP